MVPDTLRSEQLQQSNLSTEPGGGQVLVDVAPALQTVPWEPSSPAQKELYGPPALFKHI